MRRNKRIVYSALVRGFVWVLLGVGGIAGEGISAQDAGVPSETIVAQTEESPSSGDSATDNLAMGSLATDNPTEDEEGAPLVIYGTTYTVNQGAENLPFEGIYDPLGGKTVVKKRSELEGKFLTLPEAYEAVPNVSGFFHENGLIAKRWTSDSEGHFIVRNLPAGDYKVVCEQKENRLFGSEEIKIIYHNGQIGLFVYLGPEEDRRGQDRSRPYSTAKRKDAPQDGRNLCLPYVPYSRSSRAALRRNNYYNNYPYPLDGAGRRGIRRPMRRMGTYPPYLICSPCPSCLTDVIYGTCGDLARREDREDRGGRNQCGECRDAHSETCRGQPR